MVFPNLLCLKHNLRQMMKESMRVWLFGMSFVWTQFSHRWWKEARGIDFSEQALSEIQSHTNDEWTHVGLVLQNKIFLKQTPYLWTRPPCRMASVGQCFLCSWISSRCTCQLLQKPAILSSHLLHLVQTSSQHIRWCDDQSCWECGLQIALQLWSRLSQDLGRAGINLRGLGHEVLLHTPPQSVLHPPLRSAAVCAYYQLQKSTNRWAILTPVNCCFSKTKVLGPAAASPRIFFPRSSFSNKCRIFDSYKSELLKEEDAGRKKKMQIRILETSMSWQISL